MAHNMDLGEEVGKVPYPRLPGNSELTLVYAFSNPVKMHVDSLGTLLLDRVVGDADCACIVAYDWSCLLSADSQGLRVSVASLLPFGQ